jgi:hypothetical protein
MPLEIMIDTKRKRSYEVVYLRRMDELGSYWWNSRAFKTDFYRESS